MNVPDRIESFRLALSYLERAEREIEKWERVRVDRDLDRTQHDRVRARYASHRRDAQAAVEAFRREASTEIGPLEHELASARGEQRRLLRNLERGSVKPQKANDENRVLTQRVHDLHQRLAEARIIVGAESTEALGGRIDLSIDEYPKRVVAPKEAPGVEGSKGSPQTSNLVAGVLMLALVLGAIYGMYALRTVVRADIRVSAVDGDPSLVRLQCENLGNRSLLLYVPWPQSRPEPPPGSPHRDLSYGVQLYIEETGTSRLQLLEGATGIWRYRGTLVDTGTPVEVRPGRTATIFLDLGLLHDQGFDVEALRIEISRAGGSEKLQFEHELP